MTFLPVAMSVVATDGLECKNRADIGKVANACKEEEQRIQTFRGLSSVVEQELGNTAAKIQDSADITKDLAESAELQAIRLVVCCMSALFFRCRRSQVIARYASEHDKQDCCAIEEHGLQQRPWLRGLHRICVWGIFRLVVNRNSW